MRTVVIDDEYRIVRLDELNWKMQHRRPPNAGEAGEARWRDTGTYFQTLDRALAYVYEHELRRDDGRAHDLAEALEEARALRDSLLEVRVRLSGLVGLEGGEAA